MQCPSCRGYGGYRDVILDDGTGPWYECGFCRGSGEVRRHMFFRVLGWLSGIARRDKARIGSSR
jgi:hypothetical protein